MINNNTQQVFNSYEDFKQFADFAMSKKKPASKTQVTYSEDVQESVKTVLAILICLSTITEAHCMRLGDMIAATEFADKRARYNLKEEFAKDSKARQMNNRLISLCKKYEHEFKVFSYNDMEKLSDTCDAIDKAEEVMDPIILAFERLMLYKLTRKTLSTPYDPVLLKQMIVCLALLYLCDSIYTTITLDVNFPFVKAYHEFDFFKLTKMYEQVDKLLVYLDFHDTKGRPLTLSINALVQAKESKAILEDLRAMLFSYDFIRTVIVNNDDSTEPIEHTRGSMFEQLEKITLTLDEYKSKYEKMHLYQK